MMRNPAFYKLSKYDRNILLWTVLLHDICKRGKPAVEGKDPLHPFKGGWQTLHYFNDIFNFVKLSAEDLAEWDKIFEEAYHDKKGNMQQNHRIMPKVKNFFDEKLKDNDFEKEALYYILLHQSFPTLEKFPHASLLEPLESEVPKYFTKRMLKVFRIFLRHDSFSYFIYNPEKIQEFGDQIDRDLKALDKYLE